MSFEAVIEEIFSSQNVLNQLHTVSDIKKIREKHHIYHTEALQQNVNIFFSLNLFKRKNRNCLFTEACNNLLLTKKCLKILLVMNGILPILFRV